MLCYFFFFFFRKSYPATCKIAHIFEWGMVIPCKKKELCIFYIIRVLLFFLVNISEVIIEYDRVFNRGTMANLRESQYKYTGFLCHNLSFI